MLLGLCVVVVVVVLLLLFLRSQDPVTKSLKHFQILGWRGGEGGLVSRHWQQIPSSSLD